MTAHPDGPHAQSARAELDKLVMPATPPARLLPRRRIAGRQRRKTPSDVASPAAIRGSEATTLAADETCRGDEDHLEQLSKSPTSDGVIRFLIELRCEKLRPELLRLAERLDDQAPGAAVADPRSCFRRATKVLLQAPSRDRLFRQSSAAAAKNASERTSEQDALDSSLRAAFSQRRHANRWTAPACRRSFWLFSASSRGTRPGSGEPGPAAAAIRASSSGLRAASTVCATSRAASAGKAMASPLGFSGDRQDADRAAVAQSTTGFRPPSMDRVAPVM